MNLKYTQIYYQEPTESEIKTEIQKAEKFHNGKYIKHYVQNGMHKGKNTWVVEVRIKTKV